MEYRQRLQDDELKFRLECSGAVLIEGPKWSGKTTFAEHHAKSVIKMQDTDRRNAYLQTASTKPSLLLEGTNPRLIDEWQEAPVLWDAVRVSVDNRNETGLYILTGADGTDVDADIKTVLARVADYEMNRVCGRNAESVVIVYDQPSFDVMRPTSFFDYRVESEGVTMREYGFRCVYNKK